MVAASVVTKVILIAYSPWPTVERANSSTTPAIHMKIYCRTVDAPNCTVCALITTDIDMLRKKGSDPLFYYPQSNPSFAMKLSSNLGSPLHLLENYKLLSNEWMRFLIDCIRGNDRR